VNRPIVIVDPLSSGIELAPAFNAQEIPAIAVTLPHQDRLGFGSKIQTSDLPRLFQISRTLKNLLKSTIRSALFQAPRGVFLWPST